MQRKTTKIDTHCHTKGSDGWGTPQQIVECVLEANLDGICLTDHHRTYTTESLEVARECRKFGLLVFHGCEYSTAQGHLLIYGVNVADLSLGYYPDIRKVITDVNRRGGVCIPSHPYKGYRKMLGDRVLKLRGIRAIETVNGQCEIQNGKHLNRQASRAAKSRNLPGVGGSDAHNPRYIGLAYTEFQGQITCERDFLRALRSGRFRAVISRNKVQAELRRWAAQGTRVGSDV